MKSGYSSSFTFTPRAIETCITGNVIGFNVFHCTFLFFHFTLTSFLFTSDRIVVILNPRLYNWILVSSSCFNATSAFFCGSLSFILSSRLHLNCPPIIFQLHLLYFLNKLFNMSPTSFKLLRRALFLGLRSFPGYRPSNGMRIWPFYQSSQGVPMIDVILFEKLSHGERYICDISLPGRPVVGDFIKVERPTAFDTYQVLKGAEWTLTRHGTGGFRHTLKLYVEIQVFQADPVSTSEPESASERLAIETFGHQA